MIIYLTVVDKKTALFSKDVAMKRVRNHKQRNAVRKMARSHRAAQKKQMQMMRRVWAVEDTASHQG